MKLIKPDLKQCQAEIPNGMTAFRLGKVEPFTRCTKPPAFMATEIKSPKGRMTLCTSCAAVLIKQEPGRAELKPLKTQ